MPKKAKKNFPVTSEQQKFMYELANEIGIDATKILQKTKNTQNVNKSTE